MCVAAKKRQYNAGRQYIGDLKRPDRVLLSLPMPSVRGTIRRLRIEKFLDEYQTLFYPLFSYKFTFPLLAFSPSRVWSETSNRTESRDGFSLPPYV